ncbi:SH3 domain-containing protein [Hoeflea sp.]|uniref:SH3 domain-containing protein n=1 Tax=Hoeflea sp. TaxID=1940281 RepID=UPI0019A84196|nr:SH3 domain-containing protein [Hoeflea sp.]MBC7283696.1 SH3 domain-containing protein [Hoeflea sp.]
MTSSIRMLLALAAVTTATATVPALSSAFTAGTVTAIAPDDALNIRKWPGANSRIIDAYLLNEPISLTGRCKNIVTNVSFRIDGSGSASWKYARMKRANVWCQVMTNDAELGWARGKYIWPE